MPPEPTPTERAINRIDAALREQQGDPECIVWWKDLRVLFDEWYRLSGELRSAQAAAYQCACGRGLVQANDNVCSACARTRID